LHSPQVEVNIIVNYLSMEKGTPMCPRLRIDVESSSIRLDAIYALYPCSQLEGVQLGFECIVVETSPGLGGTSAHPRIARCAAGAAPGLRVGAW
jgi:hypothetical protein